MSLFSHTGADWIIAGLGNPEPKYDGTRRAGGFAAVGERADLSTLYTLLVPARRWDAARRALQQSFHP